MKTVLIVVVLLGVAVAAGASFVVQGGAQEGEASALEVSCVPAAAPLNVDTLVTCRFVARNLRSTPYANARIDLVPARSVPTPDRYVFFGASIDGVPFEVQTGQTSYSLGEIAPGEIRVLVLDVIVRSLRRSGAEAVLINEGVGEIGRALIASDPSSEAPRVQLDVRISENPLDPRMHRLLVGVSSETERITYITAEVAMPSGYSVPGEFVRPIFAAGPTPGRVPLTIVEIEPFLPPGEAETFMIDVRAEEGCYGGQIAIVFEVRNDAGDVLRPALIDEIPYVEACAQPAAEGSGGGPAALPQGGFGPDATTVESTISLAAMLFAVLGFAVVGLGIYVVR